MATLSSIRSSLHPELRLRELWLLIPAAGLALAGFRTLALVAGQEPAAGDLAPAWIFIAVLLVAHLALSLRGGSDRLILPAVATLTALGLVEVYRLAPSLAERQLVWAAAGLIVLVGVATIPWPLSWLRQYRYTLAIAGFGLVALTLVFGHPAMPGGPRLWLGTPFFSFQPSELLKVLLAVFFASYLEERRELLAEGVYRLGPFRLPPLPHLLPLLIMWGLSLLLLVVQRDLGTAMLFFGIFLSMLYVATGKQRYIWAGLLLFIAGTFVSVQLFAHVRARFDTWLDPWLQPQGESFQIVQGLEALAAGGVIGQGLGQGSPTYIPAVHTDFVLVAIAEELGLAGVIAVLCVYALLFIRGFRIALDHRDPFAQLLAVAFASTLAIQTFIIAAGNLKLIPLTGITLPFISYGGSSMLANYVMTGILLRLSTRR